jgi:hypothetical protein
MAGVRMQQHKAACHCVQVVDLLSFKVSQLLRTHRIAASIK